MKLKNVLYKENTLYLKFGRDKINLRGRHKSVIIVENVSEFFHAYRIVFMFLNLTKGIQINLGAKIRHCYLRRLL